MRISHYAILSKKLIPNWIKIPKIEYDETKDPKDLVHFTISWKSTEPQRIYNVKLSAQHERFQSRSGQKTHFGNLWTKENKLKLKYSIIHHNPQIHLLREDDKRHKKTLFMPRVTSSSSSFISCNVSFSPAEVGIEIRRIKFPSTFHWPIWKILFRFQSQIGIITLLFSLPKGSN